MESAYNGSHVAAGGQKAIHMTPIADQLGYSTVLRRFEAVPPGSGRTPQTSSHKTMIYCVSYEQILGIASPIPFITVCCDTEFIYEVRLCQPLFMAGCEIMEYRRILNASVFAQCKSASTNKSPTSSSEKYWPVVLK